MLCFCVKTAFLALLLHIIRAVYFNLRCKEVDNIANLNGYNMLCIDVPE
jgi:hypothetical protein